MPAKDLYHDAVKNALIKDGWTITHDPYLLKIGTKDMYIDLGAKRLLAAERVDQKIAVETKSFIGRSELTDLERAIGQYIIYRTVLTESEPERVLYLAIPQEAMDDLFEEPLGKLLLKNNLARLIGFNPQTEEIVEWKT